MSRRFYDFLEFKRFYILFFIYQAEGIDSSSAKPRLHVRLIARDFYPDLDCLPKARAKEFRFYSAIETVECFALGFTNIFAGAFAQLLIGFTVSPVALLLSARSAMTPCVESIGESKRGYGGEVEQGWTRVNVWIKV